MSEVSFTKRAAAELSRCFNGLAVRAKASASTAANSIATANKQSFAAAAVVPAGTDVAARPSSGVDGRRKRPGAVREFWAALTRPTTPRDLLEDTEFLHKFFGQYFTGMERCVLAQVCKTWRDVLYHPRYWRKMTAVVRCRHLRPRVNEDIAIQEAGVRAYYASLERRGFESMCLFGASDEDAADFVTGCSNCCRKLNHLTLRCCSISDKCLEHLLSICTQVIALELFGCNEITDAGLWSALTPKIICLTMADCINVADDTVAAIAQLLPHLTELNLQAYHVTDASLAYLGPRQGGTLTVLRLRSCWELTNHGLLNVVHSLIALQELSLSGCTKITDDGVELLAENLRTLRSLDLSWCPRITDASLEFIACDMASLQRLVLDRCVHVTDIGLGYLSTINSLQELYLRWCTQVRDFGLRHLCTMKHLRALSVAGCQQLTSNGLSALAQLRYLEELELTNCPGASPELLEYLHDQLFRCNILE